MNISRRKFIRRSSVLSVAALLPVTAASAAVAGSLSKTVGKTANERLSSLTRNSFAQHLDTTFEVHVSALDIQSLQLVKVSERQRYKEGEGFELLFLGQKAQQFPQGTYMIQHGEMGSLPVFLVPLNHETHAYYQAVF